MNPRDFLQALGVVIIWGFNFVAIKIAVADVPPLALSVIRFVVTGIILIPFFRLSLGQIGQLFWVGMVLGVGHFGLLMIGLQGADAATGALLIQLGVPFSSILAAIFFADKLGWKRGLGMGLAFLGGALLAGEPQGGTPVAVISLILSAFCWAWANMLIKKLKGIAPLAIVGWMGVIAAPFITVMSIFMESGQIEAIQQAPMLAWLCLGYTVIGSSVFAYHLWYSLLSRHEVNQVVPFTLLAPVIGVAAGVFILGESLSHFKVIGGLLTIIGVGTIMYRQAVKSRTS